MNKYTWHNPLLEARWLITNMHLCQLADEETYENEIPWECVHILDHSLAFDRFSMISKMSKCDLDIIHLPRLGRLM